MRLCILTDRLQAVIPSWLASRARNQNHKVDVLDPRDLTVVHTAAGLRILRPDGSEPRYDAVFPFVSAEGARVALPLLGFFEAMGIPSLNPAFSFGLALDPFRWYRRLRAEDISLPPTALVMRAEQLLGAWHALGGNPCVLRMYQGDEELGSMAVEDKEVLEDLLLLLDLGGLSFLLHHVSLEVATERFGVYVVGEATPRSFRRVAVPGVFPGKVTNVGEVEVQPPPGPIADLAVRATAAAGLCFARVDVILGPEGPLALDLLPCPSLEVLAEDTPTRLTAALLAQLEVAARNPQGWVARYRGPAGGKH